MKFKPYASILHRSPSSDGSLNPQLKFTKLATGYWTLGCINPKLFIPTLCSFSFFSICRQVRAIKYILMDQTMYPRSRLRGYLEYPGYVDLADSATYDLQFSFLIPQWNGNLLLLEFLGNSYQI